MADDKVSGPGVGIDLGEFLQRSFSNRVCFDDN